MSELLLYGYVGETLCTFSRLPEANPSHKRRFKLFEADPFKESGRCSGPGGELLPGWYCIESCAESEEEVFLLAESTGRRPLYVCAWGC